LEGDWIVYEEGREVLRDSFFMTMTRFWRGDMMGRGYMIAGGRNWGIGEGST
jgi:hypothetical protein